MTRNNSANKKEKRAHLALLCLERDLDQLEILLHHQEYLSLIAGDDDCLSLLQMAIRLRFPDLVKSLLHYHQLTDEDAASCLKDALHAGDETVVRLVAEALDTSGFRILSIEEKFIGPVFFYALEDYPELAVQMLHVAQNRQPKTVPKALNTSWRGRSPITIAIRNGIKNGDLDLFTTLKAAGANIEKSGEYAGQIAGRALRIMYTVSSMIKGNEC